MENTSDFDQCCKFFEQDLNNEELYSYLKNGTIAEKQLACIRIEDIKNEKEAEILMQNLTGIDGKVREAVSFKLKTLLPARKELFYRNNFYDIFLDAIIDINSNICRNIISVLESFSNESYFPQKIIERAHKVVDAIENFDYKDRKYITNKEVFKLYWYLEALSIFPAQEGLFGLLERTQMVEEYTIREKTALLRCKLEPQDAKRLTNLNADNNFYVNLALQRG